MIKKLQLTLVLAFLYIAYTSLVKTVELIQTDMRVYRAEAACATKLTTEGIPRENIQTHSGSCSLIKPL